MTFRPFTQARLPRTLDRYRDASGIAARKAIVDELTKGLKAGTNPTVIARRIATRVENIAATRAITIARTEMMVAQWTQSQQEFQRDARVTAWQWVARLDGRTCLICRALHGTVQPVRDRLASHPNCRCAMAPVVNGRAVIPDALTGESLFAALPWRSRRALLGDARYAEYRQTKSLQSFVATTTHPTYGPGRRLLPVGRASAPAVRVA